MKLTASSAGVAGSGMRQARGIAMCTRREALGDRRHAESRRGCASFGMSLEECISASEALTSLLRQTNSFSRERDSARRRWPRRGLDRQTSGRSRQMNLRHPPDSGIRSLARIVRVPSFGWSAFLRSITKSTWTKTGQSSCSKVTAACQPATSGELDSFHPSLLSPSAARASRVELTLRAASPSSEVAAGQRSHLFATRCSLRP